LNNDNLPNLKRFRTIGKVLNSVLVLTERLIYPSYYGDNKNDIVHGNKPLYFIKVIEAEHFGFDLSNFYNEEF